jgi:hypothetical protein
MTKLSRMLAMIRELLSEFSGVASAIRGNHPLEEETSPLKGNIFILVVRSTMDSAENHSNILCHFLSDLGIFCGRFLSVS